MSSENPPPSTWLSVAELVAQARDEDGLPLPAVWVHGEIEELAKNGQIATRGRPCDVNGEAGPEEAIASDTWRRMRFPFASFTHPHATYWNDTFPNGIHHLAYVDIVVSIADLLRQRAGGGIAGLSASSIRTASQARNEDACRKWLAGMDRGTWKKKADFREEANKRFPGLSGHAFERAWAAGAAVEWKRAGRRKR